jgi:cytoskeletal protein CcmA (bactofilin family)
VIGEGARVRARIEVDELIVGGELEGEIHARQRVELLNTARVVGTLRSPRLAVAEGGILEGRCETPPRPESS